MCWPEVYKKGQRLEFFSPRALTTTLLYSLYSSLVLCLLPLGVFQYLTLDFQTLAVTMGTSAVFMTTAEVIEGGPADDIILSILSLRATALLIPTTAITVVTLHIHQC